MLFKVLTIFLDICSEFVFFIIHFIVSQKANNLGILLAGIAALWGVVKVLPDFKAQKRIENSHKYFDSAWKSFLSFKKAVRDLIQAPKRADDTSIISSNSQLKKAVLDTIFELNDSLLLIKTDAAFNERMEITQDLIPLIEILEKELSHRYDQDEAKNFPLIDFLQELWCYNLKKQGKEIEATENWFEELKKDNVQLKGLAEILLRYYNRP